MRYPCASITAWTTDPEIKARVSEGVKCLAIQGYQLDEGRALSLITEERDWPKSSDSDTTENHQ